jgi:N-acylneuraminate cytidylyltransferase
MTNLAIIPARGGSKRIPAKNIKNFLGKPIIRYAIESALSTKLFEEITVSTDSEEIASIAISSGASVPFIRSKKNSDDWATLSDVLLEVLHEYEEQKKDFDAVCMILPTAVFVCTENLLQGYHKLVDGNFSSVIPVAKYSYAIQRALFQDDAGRLAMLWPENKNTRSQDLTPAYYDCGQFYWINTKDFLKEKSILMNNSGSIILNAEKVQDIDTTEDWAIAEMKYQMLKKK